MPTAVVKLGSSVVAEPSGDLRPGVLDRICDDVATLHAAGVDVVVVTSGAIARGMRLLELPVRPRAIEDLQAASAVGQGKLYRVYDELLRDRGLTSAQVLLTFFDMSARTHYVNARRTLRKLLDWRIVPVINENDTTTTDEVSFGDNDFLAAQVAVLVGAELLVLLTDTGGLYTADPRLDPTAKLVDEVSDLEALGALEIGAATSPLGSGGMRSKVVAAEMATAAGIATVIASGPRARRHRARVGGGARGDALPPRSGAPLELQAVAEVRQAVARDAVRRRRRGAGAARGRDVAAARRHRRGRGQLRRRRRGRDPRGRRQPDRQGDLQLLGGRAAPRDGPQVGPGARGAAARDRGSGPPGLLRARLNWLCMAVATPSVTDICLAAQAASRELAGHELGGQGRARCCASPTRSRSARRRSSRPTRATSRRAASPGSRTR